MDFVFAAVIAVMPVDFLFFVRIDFFPLLLVFINCPGTATGTYFVTTLFVSGEAFIAGTYETSVAEVFVLAQAIRLDVNKMDKMGDDFLRTIEMIKERL